MKLLIVEDETIARKGLLGSLDWAELGIDSVMSAENGESGLSLARRVLPDIVITDIRMPRMDGITMASRIRDFLPDCRIIFLSAYSDIDYYKAAIELKAIRYLNKPVETPALKDVVMQAMEECRELSSNKSLTAFHKLHEKQNFADALCQGEDSAQIEKDAKRLGITEIIKKSETVTAVIIARRPRYEDEPRKDQLQLALRISKAISQQSLYTVRHKSNLVFFLFTPNELSNFAQNHLCEKVATVLENEDFYVVIGSPVKGIGNAHNSYVCAKKAMQKAYCYPFGSAVVYNEAIEAETGLFAYVDEKNRIIASLSEKDQQGALAACAALRDSLYRHKDLTQLKARQLYYELIAEVFRLSEQSHLDIRENDAGDDIFWAVRIESYNLDELHAYLCAHINRLFAAIKETKNEKRQILAIKEYIAANYPNPTLSVSDISNHLHMSASHVCTMFKKETGNTINGYLTDYRLGRAKKYLDESLLSIADISAKIGYKDNSYFGRIFRKHFGLTPLEYRNRDSQ